MRKNCIEVNDYVAVAFKIDSPYQKHTHLCWHMAAQSFEWNTSHATITGKQWKSKWQFLCEMRLVLLLQASNLSYTLQTPHCSFCSQWRLMGLQSIKIEVKALFAAACLTTMCMAMHALQVCEHNVHQSLPLSGVHCWHDFVQKIDTCATEHCSESRCSLCWTTSSWCCQTRQ